MQPTDQDQKRSEELLPVNRQRNNTTETRFVDLIQAPVLEGIDVPPRITSTEAFELNPIDHVREVVVPQTHIKEVYRTREEIVHEKREIKQPKIQVLHRKIEIPKPVKRKEVVHVPQLHVVDKITEKFVDVEKERTILKPQYIFQEHRIPIPKRKVEEITVKLPQEEYEKIVEAPLNAMDFGADDIMSSPQGLWDADRGMYTSSAIRPGMPDPNLTSSLIPKEFSDISGLITSPIPPREDESPTGPIYRHIPKPVEIPVMHYKPKYVERHVDRHVPVPVKISVKQEIRVPTLVPVWQDVPVPVQVTRNIEKPVPVDAMFNKAMLAMYLRQTSDIDAAAAARADRLNYGWKFNNRGPFINPVLYKMTEEEKAAAGLTEQFVAPMSRSFGENG